MTCQYARLWDTEEIAVHTCMYVCTSVHLRPQAAAISIVTCITVQFIQVECYAPVSVLFAPFIVTLTYCFKAEGI